MPVRHEYPDELYHDDVVVQVCPACGFEHPVYFEINGVACCSRCRKPLRAEEVQDYDQMCEEGKFL